MNRERFSRPVIDFKTLYIFGAGGHGREIAWLARTTFGDAINIIHLVSEERYVLESVNGNAVNLLANIRVEKSDRFVAALGDSAARREAVNKCMAIGLSAVRLVHPAIEISKWLELGAGSVLCAGSIVTTNIKIGEHVHINIGATISHDVSIGDFSTISPGVHVSGHVKIGQNVFIGTGANIINGSDDKPLIIGDNAIIAAGACVIRSVAPLTMVAGVPAVKKS